MTSIVWFMVSTCHRLFFLIKCEHYGLGKNSGIHSFRSCAIWNIRLLKNKSLRQAISLLETNAFRVGHLYYIKHFAKDVVRFSKLEDRKLSFNDTLPKFSIIDLYLGDGYSDGVFVPNLKGLELYEVKRKLNNNSLNLGKSYISDSIVDSTKIVIYEQNPKADEKVQIGTFVTVWGRDSVIHIID